MIEACNELAFFEEDIHVDDIIKMIRNPPCHKKNCQIVTPLRTLLVMSLLGSKRKKRTCDRSYFKNFCL